MSLHTSTYMYSSGNYMPCIYWKCDSCGSEIVCRAEDMDTFTTESIDMKCPKCGARALDYFKLDIKAEQFIPIVDAILKNREENIRRKLAEEEEKEEDRCY